MYSRWYEVAVVLLWLAAMSWLVGKKVLPSLMIGEPPDAVSILEAQDEDRPTGWSMFFNGRELGWAINTAGTRLDGSTELRTRVHFNELPLDEIVPKWARKMLGEFADLKSQMEMETRSRMVFDDQGKLLWFESSVQFEPGVSAIEVRGVIEGSMVSLNLNSGTFKYETEMSIPRNAMLDDALSPQAHLPGLRQGQKWTLKLYSPLRPPGSPAEILQAEVEGVQPMRWNNRAVDTWLVTYRGDPGSILGGSDEPVQTLWVDPDGSVLKQQATLFDMTVTFVRLGSEEAAALAEEVEEEQLSGSTEAVGHQRSGIRDQALEIKHQE